MDSSTFFQYPSGTVSGDSGSASNPQFLDDLREDEVRDVLSYTRARRYGRGRLATRRGDTNYGLYVITAGCFEAVEPATDGCQRKALLRPGDIFGGLAFFDHQPQSADVRAVDDSEAVVMTATSFDRLRLMQPQLALRFVLHLGRIVSLGCRQHILQLAMLGEP